MFRQDERRFCINIDLKQGRKGIVPEMEKFVQFWASISEN